MPTTTQNDDAVIKDISNDLAFRLTPSNEAMEATRWLRKRLGMLLAKHRTELEEVRNNYNELILAVACKFEGETRHQTALRYIREAETVKLEELTPTLPTDK